MASEGPPQPPEFRKILMGVGSFPLKYSSTCVFAASVNSIIVTLLVQLFNVPEIITGLNSLTTGHTIVKNQELTCQRAL